VGGGGESDWAMSAAPDLYRASPVKRRRATRDEMGGRAAFLVDYARRHAPVTVRQLFYRAGVEGVAGIGKDESGYRKVQDQVLRLRRGGSLPYEHIADATRWMRKPRSYDSIEEAARETAELYRKSLWRDAPVHCEVWCEKDALAGVIYPETAALDTALMVARGFTSETFCFEAIEARAAADDDKLYVVYSLFDFDRSGRDAADSLKEKLERFAAERGVRVLFIQLAIAEEDVIEFDAGAFRARVTFTLNDAVFDWWLPTREPKRKSRADQLWAYPFAIELDAIEPDELRRLVRTALELHLAAEELRILKTIEENERELFRRWATTVKGE
jgi:hypothetical protein